MAVSFSQYCFHWLSVYSLLHIYINNFKIIAKIEQFGLVSNDFESHKKRCACTCIKMADRQSYIGQFNTRALRVRSTSSVLYLGEH